MENTSELLPCPFCGGKPELITRGNEHTKKRSAEIYCKNCVLTMVVGVIRYPMTWAIDKVTEKWNTRRQSPESSKLIKYKQGYDQGKFDAGMCVEEIIQEAKNRWSFNNNQEPTHTWHDKQEFIKWLRDNYSRFYRTPESSELTYLEFSEVVKCIQECTKRDYDGKENLAIHIIGHAIIKKFGTQPSKLVPIDKQELQKIELEFCRERYTDSDECGDKFGCLLNFNDVLLNKFGATAIPSERIKNE